ncbi:MAG TPA: Maf family protein [Lachnospiraceae bacterium]|jgi:septum formation protein|nr:Maf family protein [Lachnospiraceae bacterium]
MRKVILASGSPRRKDILEQAGIPFEIILPTLTEEVTDQTKPEEIVKDLSRQKAENVAELLDATDDYMIIGADTVVAYEGQIFGKPKDREDAFRMLSLLQGNVHQVYTGVTFVYTKQNERKTHSFHVTTDVRMYPMNEEQIKGYIDTEEPLDKAGAYAIQGKCCVYIEEIKGEYNNVVGFPIAHICEEMKITL